MKPALRALANVYLNVAHIKSRLIAFSPRSGNAGIPKPHVGRQLILWLAVALLGLPLPLSATSIVAIRTEAGFVIAADSGSSDDNGKLLPVLTCKVFSVGRSIVFGIAGIERAPGFSPEIELRKHIMGNDLQVMADNIERDINPLLKQQAERLRRDVPHKFEELLTNEMFQFFIATSTGYVSRGYRIALNPDHTIKMLSGEKDCIGGSCKAGRILRLGHTEEIDSFFASGQYVRFKSLGDEAKYLVHLEISAHPNDTSCPIDLLEITEAGIKWQERKPECKRK